MVRIASTQHRRALSVGKLSSSFPFPVALTAAEHNPCVLTQVKVSKDAGLVPLGLPWQVQTVSYTLFSWAERKSAYKN